MYSTKVECANPAVRVMHVIGKRSLANPNDGTNRQNTYEVPYTSDHPIDHRPHDRTISSYTFSWYGHINDGDDDPDDDIAEREDYNKEQTQNGMNAGKKQTTKGIN
jgi:hypothetical protein